MKARIRQTTFIQPQHSITKTGASLAIAIALSACTSISVDELNQFDADQARSTLAGHTLSQRTEYGRWAEYFSDSDLSGAGKAWGDWGEEKATSQSTITEDGEICSVYEAEYDWSTPDYQYCFVIYQDTEGNHLTKVTKNDRRPERLGNVRKAEFIAGDKYGLVE